MQGEEQAKSERVRCLRRDPAEGPRSDGESVASAGEDGRRSSVVCDEALRIIEHPTVHLARGGEGNIDFSSECKRVEVKKKTFPAKSLRFALPGYRPVV